MLAKIFGSSLCNKISRPFDILDAVAKLLQDNHSKGDNMTLFSHEVTSNPYAAPTTRLFPQGQSHRFLIYNTLCSTVSKVNAGKLN